MAGRGWYHPLADGCPPEWASAWGEDQYGIFVEFRIGDVDQRMRWIRPGNFKMGSEGDPEAFDAEEPQHEVALTRGFWMADTPVTQALWEAVTGDNSSRFEGELQRPVEQVSWDDCQRFCAALSERLSGPVFRLPTEAEWEYACRAGTNTPRYGGLDEIAWYSENSAKRTHPVKSKQANHWGLFDTLGNVWEWCSDYAYRPYGSSAQQDPRGPAAAERRVIRGGAWSIRARGVRAAIRAALDPGYKSDLLGLRLARDQG